MGSVTPRPHALIIEDELLVGMSLQAMLSDLGYRSFSFAGTERQALEQAGLHCPDLVTVDVGLLDGSGARAIDDILQDCGPLPVVYVTGMAEAVLDRPGAVVVEKPISLGALRQAVEAARRTPQAARRSGRRPSEGLRPQP